MPIHPVTRAATETEVLWVQGLRGLRPNGATCILLATQPGPHPGARRVPAGKSWKGAGRRGKASEPKRTALGGVSVKRMK